MSQQARRLKESEDTMVGSIMNSSLSPPSHDEAEYDGSVSACQNG